MNDPVPVAIERFLAARRCEQAHDLVGRYHPTMECQLNTVGHHVDEQPYKTDGAYRWWNLRTPKDAHKAIAFPLEHCAERIGISGWDFGARASLWAGYDFDSIAAHGKGLTPQQLDEVRTALESLDYVEIRRSTSGSGLHIWVAFDSISTEDHNAHATLARAVLGKMSADSRRALASDVDSCGRILWIWTNDPKPHSFELLKTATRSLQESDLPGWRDSISPPKAPKAPIDPISNIDWDGLCNPCPPAPIDDEHRAIIGALTEGGWPCHLTGQGCYQTHTVGLAEVHKALRLRGTFATQSPGTDRNKPNSYIFPAAGGAFRVKRFPGNTEGAGWAMDSGRPCCDFNPPLKQSAEPRLYTCSELVKGDFTPRYLIQDCLVEFGSCILGGSKKTLKTTVAIDMAISLATATPFLGRFAVDRPKRVLLLSGESGLGQLQESALRIAKSKNVDLEKIENLILSDWLPRFPEKANLTALANLEKVLDRSKADVFILDPTYLAMPGADTGNVCAMGERLRLLNDICLPRNITPVLSHHLRKRAKNDRNYYDMPEIDDLSGAGYPEWMRQWILLGRRCPYLGGSEHQLWMNVGGSAGHCHKSALNIYQGTDRPRIWNVRLLSCNDAKEEKSTVTTRQKIVDAMANFPNGEVKSSILLSAKLTRGVDVTTVFESLLSEGVLVETKVLRGKRHFAGFILAPAWKAPPD